MSVQQLQEQPVVTEHTRSQPPEYVQQQPPVDPDIGPEPSYTVDLPPELAGDLQQAVHAYEHALVTEAVDDELYDNFNPNGNTVTAVTARYYEDAFDNISWEPPEKWTTGRTGEDAARRKSDIAAYVDAVLAGARETGVLPEQGYVDVNSSPAADTVGDAPWTFRHHDQDVVLQDVINEGITVLDDTYTAELQARATAGARYETNGPCMLSKSAWIDQEWPKIAEEEHGFELPYEQWQTMVQRWAATITAFETVLDKVDEYAEEQKLRARIAEAENSYEESETVDTLAEHTASSEETIQEEIEDALDAVHVRTDAADGEFYIDSVLFAIWRGINHYFPLGLEDAHEQFLEYEQRLQEEDPETYRILKRNAPTNLNPAYDDNPEHSDAFLGNFYDTHGKFHHSNVDDPGDNEFGILAHIAEDGGAAVEDHAIDEETEIQERATMQYHADSDQDEIPQLMTREQAIREKAEEIRAQEKLGRRPKEIDETRDRGIW